MFSATGPRLAFKSFPAAIATTISNCQRNKECSGSVHLRHRRWPLVTSPCLITHNLTNGPDSDSVDTFWFCT
jgi:hypothetical protein